MTDRGTGLSPSLRPPAPPAELRSRTLEAARAAVNTSGPDVWTRIWESAAARLAWAVSVAALVMGHLALGGGAAGAQVSPALPLNAVTASGGELTELAELPRLAVDLPGIEVVGETVITKPIEARGDS